MDTSRLVIESTLPIPVGAVWPAVTEPARISVWFTDCTALPGARYRLEFAEKDGPHVKHAQILACEPDPGRRYRFRLEDPGYPDSTVEIHLSAAGSATTAQIVHERPPADLVEGYRTGWRDYLEALRTELTKAGPE